MYELIRICKTQDDTAELVMIDALRLPVEYDAMTAHTTHNGTRYQLLGSIMLPYIVIN